MDPLVTINESLKKNEIPEDIFKKVSDSVKKVNDVIIQIEKASNIKYPEWYVYPKALVMKAPVGGSSIVYSRFFPFSYENVLYTLVQVTPPLVLYASKDTLLAVMAHEFLHYVNFIAGLKNFSITSEEETTSVFESVFKDEAQLYDEEKVFKKSKKIKRLLKEKFSGGLNDEALNKKTLARWFKKGLPVDYIYPEGNISRISVISILNFKPEETIKRFLNWT
ncbi:MAG: hypothetical protein RXR36_02505 [Nitrososphaeria archaeon]